MVSTNELRLRQIAEDLTIKYCGNKLAVGRCFIYRKDGDLTKPGIPVEIVGGYFLDPIYNRLSNFWHWRRILPNGKLGKEGCGYGGNEPFFVYISRHQAVEWAGRASTVKYRKVIADYWSDHYVHNGLCSLCGNQGVIDTRITAVSCAGVRSGRLNWCICPNGQILRRIHKGTLPPEELK